jgi:hypothetical protein
MASRVSGSFTVVRFMVCQHTPTPDSARNRRSGGGPQSRRPCRRRVASTRRRAVHPASRR